METTHNYFRTVGGIAGCLMEYHVLKNQVIRTWKKGFPDVQRRVKEAKEYIIKISYFIFNLS